MQCGYGGLGDGQVSLWGLVEAWGGGSLACWHSGDGLCCCTLFLQPLLWGHELLNRKSPLGCLVTSFLLPSTEADLAQDKMQVHKCLLTPDRDWAVAITLQRLALTRHLFSSLCSLAINWSWSVWGSTLGATLYCPLYICSATSRISWSVDPKRVLIEGCSRTIPLAISVYCGWGAFASVSVALFFALLWHYETTFLAGKAPTPGT